MVRTLVYSSDHAKQKIALWDNLKSIEGFISEHETFSKDEITPYLTSALSLMDTSGSGSLFFKVDDSYVKLRSLLNTLNSQDSLSMEREFVQFKNYMDYIRNGLVSIGDKEIMFYSQIGLASGVDTPN